MHATSDPELHPSGRLKQLSAAANIFLGREIRGWLVLRDDRAMEQAASRLLKELECDIHPRQIAGALRVGDQQLIEIAKALSLQSDILIMDEPTSALAEAEVSRLYRVIERLRKRGVTILYISHKMDEIFHLADRITVLRDGRLVKTLDPTLELRGSEGTLIRANDDWQEDPDQAALIVAAGLGLTNAKESAIAATLQGGNSDTTTIARKCHGRTKAPGMGVPALAGKIPLGP